MGVSLGERMRLLRVKKQETQKQTADAIGIEPSTLSRYENCQRETQWEILVHIARHFNTSADYLLGLTDNPLPADWDAQKMEIEKDYPEVVDCMRKMNASNRSRLSERAMAIVEMQEAEDNIKQTE